MAPITNRLAGVGGMLAAVLLARRLWGRRDQPFRHALVTGGSRGLGFAIARELVRRGVAVSFCGRDPETLERARALLAPQGRVFARPCDLARAEEVDALLREAKAAFGPVDLLVNNAAVIQVGPLEDMTYEDFEEALRVNLLAPLRLVLSLLPDMRARRAGHIVNVASIGGRLSMPHLLPYNTSKFALTGFSEGLRSELAGTGVSVTTVCPGLTRTGSPRHAAFKGRRRAEHAWFAVSDALPVVSGDAVRTARRIVEAAERGQADLVTTLPARLAAPVHGLFPGATADVLGLVHRWLLPRPDGAGVVAAPGRECRSAWAPSPLTRAADAAARDLNQEAPLAPPGREEVAPAATREPAAPRPDGEDAPPDGGRAL